MRLLAPSSMSKNDRHRIGEKKQSYGALTHIVLCELKQAYEMWGNAPNGAKILCMLVGCVDKLFVQCGSCKTQEGKAHLAAAADRLSKMIDDLLDASRLQAGGLSLNRADVSLPTLSKRIVERLAMQSKNHTILTDFPENFPVILADETRVEQVIVNLVSNALKYASKGEIKISGTARPEQVVICVSDEGPGIEAKDLPHIFDRFYRSTKAVKHTKGAGLGLYLARAIVEAHGGRIWADALTGSVKAESGARICFSLPR